MRVFLCFLAIGVLFFSCGVEREDNRVVFNYNESNGITSLDPAMARNLENMWACNQLFDGLVELNDSLKIVPGLAQSWSISEDGLRYRFKLRNDVYFHHDTAVFGSKGSRKLVAEDVAFSFKRILNDDLASPGRWIFQRVDTSSDSAFVAVNDSTFEIRLKAPFPPFLGLLTTQYGNILPQEAIDYYGAEFRSKPVGTGPFKFSFWMEDVALVFHKNPNYWKKNDEGEALPYLDAVKIDFVKDMGAEFQGLLKGKYDFLSGIHPAYKDELLNAEGQLREGFDDIYFQKNAFIKTDYIGILVDDSIAQNENQALRNRLVRQALNFGLDRRKMVRFLRNNTVFPAEQGFIPKGMPPFSENVGYGYTYQPELAAQLLEEAGYPNGKDIHPIEISTTGDYVDLIEFVQHNLSELGIEVKVNVLQSGAHRELVSKSQLPLFRKSWFADYADAENFLSLFYSENFSPSGPNYTHFSSAKFDSLFEQSIQTIDDKERLALYRRMDSLVMNEAPIIPLYYDQVSHFLRKEVQDFPTNPVNMLDLTRVKKVR